jgi:hypothetical protein
MKTDKLSVLANLKAFHNDEDGIETMQVVMILGIAAIVLLVLWNFFPGIKKWVKDFVDKLTKVKISSSTVN